MSAPIPGWMAGRGVAIGTMLPEADWVSRGIYRDNSDAKNDPPHILPSDYMVPVPFFHEVVTSIVMGAMREDSRADEYMHELQLRGIGISPDGVTVLEWANQLSEEWYGVKYEDMNQLGRPDLIMDYGRRNNIRAAMCTMSWSAWLAMQVAQSKDAKELAGHGAIGADVSATTVGAVAAVVPFPANLILGLVAAGVGALGAILVAAADGTIDKILRNIENSAYEVALDDAATMCAVFTIATEHGGEIERVSSEAAVALTQAANSLTKSFKDKPNIARQVLSNCSAARRAMPVLWPDLPVAVVPIHGHVIRPDKPQVLPKLPPLDLSHLEQPKPTVLSALKTPGKTIQTAFWGTDKLSAPMKKRVLPSKLVEHGADLSLYAATTILLLGGLSRAFKKDSGP